MTITATCINVFSCAHQANGQYTLAEDPDIICFQGDWNRIYFPIAVITFVLWCVCMPLRLAFLAQRAVSRRRQWKRAIKKYDSAENNITMSNQQYIQLIRDKVRYGCTYRCACVCMSGLVLVRCCVCVLCTRPCPMLWKGASGASGW